MEDTIARIVWIKVTAQARYDIETSLPVFVRNRACKNSCPLIQNLLDEQILWSWDIYPQRLMLEINSAVAFLFDDHYLVAEGLRARDLLDEIGGADYIRRKLLEYFERVLEPEVFDELKRMVERAKQYNHSYRHRNTLAHRARQDATCCMS